MRAAILALALAGCAAAPEVQTVEVKIPIPVKCRVQLPEAPRWAMDAIFPDADIDTLMAAALAEIAQREGYEIQLKAAIAACNEEAKP